INSKTLAPITYSGKATLNLGGGNATISLKSLGGHTSINSTNGSDTINIDDQAAHTLAHDQGLLTVASDIPQATVSDLADGSPAGISFGVSTLGTIQMQILASGSRFEVSLSGGAATSALNYNIAGGPTATLITTTPGVNGTTSQVDKLTIGGDGGQYELVFNVGNGNGPQSTAPIAWNALATGPNSVQSAIETLLGAGTVVNVTGTGATATAYIIPPNNPLGNPLIQVNGGVVNDGVRPTSTGLTLSGSLQSALNALTSIHDFIKETDPMDGSVRVVKFGNTYRINFLD